MKRVAQTFWILILSLIISGCAIAQESKAEKIPFGGKFIFSSTREGITLKDDRTYIFENGNIRKVAGELGNPKWSPDGTKFLASDSNKHIIYLIDEKGLVLREISTDGFPSEYQFFPDQKKIIYGCREKLNERNSSIFNIFIYDFATDRSTLVHSLLKNQYLMTLRLSNDGSKFAYSANDVLYFKAPRELGVFDFETKTVKSYHPNTFSVIGWLPGDNEILVEGNVKEDGTKFNNSFGILATINVDSGEFKVLRDETRFYIQSSLSKDGRYLIYIRKLKNGQSIFVNELATNKEFLVTGSIPIGNTGYFSIDDSADWHQA